MNGAAQTNANGKPKIATFGRQDIASAPPIKLTANPVSGIRYWRFRSCGGRGGADITAGWFGE